MRAVPGCACRASRWVPGPAKTDRPGPPRTALVTTGEVREPSPPTDSNRADPDAAQARSPNRARRESPAAHARDRAAPPPRTTRPTAPPDAHAGRSAGADGSDPQCAAATAAAARESTTTPHPRTPAAVARTHDAPPPAHARAGQPAQPHPRQTPAVMQLQRIAIAHRHTRAPLRRHRPPRIDLYPVVRLHHQIGPIRLTPRRHVLPDELPAHRPTPRRLPRSTRPLHRNNHRATLPKTPKRPTPESTP